MFSLLKFRSVLNFFGGGGKYTWNKSDCKLDGKLIPLIIQPSVDTNRLLFPRLNHLSSECGTRVLFHSLKRYKCNLLKLFVTILIFKLFPEYHACLKQNMLPNFNMQVNFAECMNKIEFVSSCYNIFTHSWL